jgi:hypothetical protein
MKVTVEFDLDDIREAQIYSLVVHSDKVVDAIAGLSMDSTPEALEHRYKKDFDPMNGHGAVAFKMGLGAHAEHVKSIVDPLIGLLK